MQSFVAWGRLIISLFIGNSGVLTAFNSAFKYARHLFENAVHRILERLCRYITRPAVSTERLSLTTQGNIQCRLKTPYRDGTTDVVFEPLDKIAGSDFERPQAGPQGEGQEARSTSWLAWQPWCRRREPIPDQVRGRLWAQRLKRVFKIDLLTCEHCGGAVKV